MKPRVLVVPVFPQASETFIVAKLALLVARGWDYAVRRAARRPVALLPRAARTRGPGARAGDFAVGRRARPSGQDGRRARSWRASPWCVIPASPRPGRWAWPARPSARRPADARLLDPDLIHVEFGAIGGADVPRRRVVDPGHRLVPRVRPRLCGPRGAGPLPRGVGAGRGDPSAGPRPLVQGSGGAGPPADDASRVHTARGRPRAFRRPGDSPAGFPGLGGTFTC